MFDYRNFQVGPGLNVPGILNMYEIALGDEDDIDAVAEFML
jgi:hypothetical protein